LYSHQYRQAGRRRALESGAGRLPVQVSSHHRHRPTIGAIFARRWPVTRRRGQGRAIGVPLRQGNRRQWRPPRTGPTRTPLGQQAGQRQFPGWQSGSHRREPTETNGAGLLGTWSTNVSALTSMRRTATNAAEMVWESTDQMSRSDLACDPRAIGVGKPRPHAVSSVQGQTVTCCTDSEIPTRVSAGEDR
jgi:hypothetical protein